MVVKKELNCRLAVVNRQGGVIKDFSWGLITLTNMYDGYRYLSSNEPFIIVQTLPFISCGSKYKVLRNIEHLFFKFLNQGQATVCLKEPRYNILITKAEPDKLKPIISCLKKLLPNDSPPRFFLDLPVPRINLYLSGQRNYKLRMETILRRNINLDHFTEMEISNCTLELEGDQVPIAGAIRNMKNLKTLRLERIELHSSIFLEVESRELKGLYLCYSKIPLQASSLFKNDPCYKDSLVELNLAGNRLSEIPNGVFEFRNLLKLSLNENCITELPDKFTNLSKLQELELIHNELALVPPCIFEIQNLIRLSLCNNHITELPDITTNSSKLYELSLSSNQLRCLPSSIFEFRNLSSLSLRTNCITELPDMFAKLSKLRILNLSHNQLRSAPPSIFQLQNLSELYLYNNFISELPNIINLPKLEFLWLANNQLRRLPARIVALQNLSLLHLRNNLITELPDMFANLPKLKTLILSRNQLKHLPPSICSLHLKQLDIDYNEFDFENIPPSFGSETIVHSLKELSYRTILNHKLIVKKGMLPEKCLKDLAKYRQCICGCKYVGEEQDMLYLTNLNDISRFIYYIHDPHFIVQIRGKICSSLKTCFLDRFTKCR